MATTVSLLVHCVQTVPIIRTGPGKFRLRFFVKIVFVATCIKVDVRRNEPIVPHSGVVYHLFKTGIFARVPYRSENVRFERGNGHYRP